MITDAKILSKRLANEILHHIKKVLHNNQFAFILGMSRWLNIHKSRNVTQHINRSKDKNDISSRLMPKFSISMSFDDKFLNKLGIEMYFNLIKSICDKHRQQHTKWGKN
jgi:hypothetical protein